MKDGRESAVPMTGNAWFELFERRPLTTFVGAHFSIRPRLQ